MKIGITGGVLLAITTLVVGILLFAHPSKVALLGVGSGGGGGSILLIAYAMICQAKKSTPTSPPSIEPVVKEKKTRIMDQKPVKKTPTPFKETSSRSTPQSTQLLPDFYMGEGKDIEGRSFEDILKYSHQKLESAHDYIQWLFPLPEGSGTNSKAPQLTPQILTQLKESSIAKERLKRAFDKMLNFYGLTFNESRTEIVKGVNWEERKKNWLSQGNHNYLRITRILAFLCDMGLNSDAQAFFKVLQDIQKVEAGKIGRAFQFWESAVK